jgi:hypothetical protein
MLQAGRPGFDSRQKLGLLHRSTPAPRPTQPHIRWVPGALSLGVKWSGREADHLPPSSAEVKNAWGYTTTLHTPSWPSAWLSIAAILCDWTRKTDNFTLTIRKCTPRKDWLYTDVLSTVFYANGFRHVAEMNDKGHSGLVSQNRFVCQSSQRPQRRALVLALYSLGQSLNDEVHRS